MTITDTDVFIIMGKDENVMCKAAVSARPLQGQAAL